MNTTRAGLVVLVVCLLAVPAAAHVPSFPDDNTTPERALQVPDAVKSWSFYDRLDRGQARYYRFSLDAGQRLRVGTFTPQSDAFTPSLMVMSPALNASGPAPPGVPVPEEMGWFVVAGERPGRATYEPFAPSANYHTADVDRPVETDRTYLVAVYEADNRSGQVGVALGYSEEFSPTEYAMVPFDLVQTRLWTGQHPLVLLAPWLLTLLGGAAFVRHRLPEDWNTPAVRGALVVAGLLVLGSAVSTAVQTVLALATTGPTAGVLVTAAFVVVPLACGIWVLRVALRDELVFPPRTRVGLAAASVAVLVTWAGFVVAPVILGALALLPTRGRNE
ncbi:MAG: hypothetical protein V5A28_02700 [Haloarculaceae archaeon]